MEGTEYSLVVTTIVTWHPEMEKKKKSTQTARFYRSNQHQLVSFKFMDYIDF